MVEISVVRKIRRLMSKEMRQYKLMNLRHRIDLMKAVWKFREWDFSFTHRIVMLAIKGMHEYYSEGNNVFQTDETRLPIVESLQHIIDQNEILEEDLVSGFEKYDEVMSDIYTRIGKDCPLWWD